MKKFLSLALVLVMLLSTLTVGVSAEKKPEFTDDYAIQYAEAVDVVRAIGIIDGYEDGSFGPDRTLTRGAAAKIICNLIVGPAATGAMVTAEAPYSDVPADHTFAGYIAYCKEEGIISGYADGTFRPADTLSGNAFLKMLLGALGYDAVREGYVGANWTISVAKRAMSIGLDEGLTEEFVGVNSVTREQACLYVLNTLKATMVQYNSSNTVEVGGVTINDETEAEEVVNVASGETIENDDLMQFAEYYYSKLVYGKGAADEMGRPSVTWHFDKEEVGTYAKSADVFYSGYFVRKDVYNTIGLQKDTTVAKYYVNGVDTARPFKVLKKADGTEMGGYGVQWEFYYDKDTDSLTMLEITPYAGQVVSVQEATDTDPRTVTVDGLEFETLEFEMDDIVVYTKNDATDEIQTMVPATKMANAQITRVTGTTDTTGVLISGKTYYITNGYRNSLIGVLQQGATVDVWLDMYGYIVHAEKNAGTGNVVYTLAFDSDTSFGETTYKARVLKSDGTTEDVITAANYNSAAYKNTFVRMTKNSEGKYAFTQLSVVKSQRFGSPNISVPRNYAKFSVEGVEYNKNSNTVFLVKSGTGSNAKYTAYSGADNIYIAPDSDATVVMYLNPDISSLASLVYVEGADVTSGESGAIFLYAAKGYSTIDDGTLGTYYTTHAIVDGSVVTMKMNKEPARVNQLYTNVVYDNNGVMDIDASAAYIYKTSGDAGYDPEDYALKDQTFVDRLDDTLIELSGGVYSIAEDAVVWKMTMKENTVNKYDTIARSTIHSLTGGESVQWAVVKEDVIVELYFVAHPKLYAESAPDLPDYDVEKTGMMTGISLNSAKDSLLVRVNPPVDLTEAGWTYRVFATTLDEINLVADNEYTKYTNREVGNCFECNTPISGFYLANNAPDVGDTYKVTVVITAPDGTTYGETKDMTVGTRITCAPDYSQSMDEVMEVRAFASGAYAKFAAPADMSGSWKTNVFCVDAATGALVAQSTGNRTDIRAAGALMQGIATNKNGNVFTAGKEYDVTVVVTGPDNTTYGNTTRLTAVSAFGVNVIPMYKNNLTYVSHKVVNKQLVVTVKVPQITLSSTSRWSASVVDEDGNEVGWRIGSNITGTSGKLQDATAGSQIELYIINWADSTNKCDAYKGEDLLVSIVLPADGSDSNAVIGTRYGWTGTIRIP